MNISLKQVEQVALPRYNLKNLEDLYAGIGSGDIRLNQLVNFLQSRLIKVTAEEADQEILRPGQGPCQAGIYFYDDHSSAAVHEGLDGQGSAVQQ